MFFILLFAIISLSSAQNKGEENTLRDTLIYLGFLNRFGCDSILKLNRGTENKNKLNPFVVESIDCGIRPLLSLRTLSQDSLQKLNYLTNQVKLPGITITQKDSISVTIGSKKIEDLGKMSEYVFGVIQKNFSPNGYFILHGCEFLDGFMSDYNVKCDKRSSELPPLPNEPKKSDDRKKEQTKPKKRITKQLQNRIPNQVTLSSQGNSPQSIRTNNSPSTRLSKFDTLQKKFTK